MAQATGSTPKPDAASPAKAGAAATPKEPTFKEPPKYQLLEPAYINETLYESERQPMITGKETGEEIRRPIIITCLGRPGAHMKPVNAAAEHMYKKHPPATLNPIDKLSIIGPEAEVIAPSRPTA